MIIQQIYLKKRGYPPIDIKFNSNLNIVIGLNGSGKTFLLNVIATLSGSDDATFILAGHEIEKFFIKILHDNTTYEYEGSDRFDSDSVNRFKSTLPARTNYVLTEKNCSFVEKCDELATSVSLFNKMTTQSIGCYKDFGLSAEHTHSFSAYCPSMRTAYLRMGDAHSRLMSMFLNDSPDGYPALIDEIERHLDITTQRIILKYLLIKNRQLIAVTHSPCVMSNYNIDDCIVNMS